jgi:hypothetical protein
MKSLRQTLALLCAAGVLTAATTTFAADEKKPAAPDNQPTKATIAEILAYPDAYAGKEVTVQARLADVCAGDGCLTLKDKLDMIEGEPPPQGFKKKPKVGSTLSVTGTVTVKGEGEGKHAAIAVKKLEEVKR